MAIDLTTLDAHEQPSDHMRAIWKGYSRREKADLLNSGDIDDLLVPEKAAEFCKAGSIPADRIKTAFSHLTGDGPESHQVEQDADIYYHSILPGLLIVPNLIPPNVQKALLSRLIHRDLSQPHHQTNMHLHYDIPYPQNKDDMPEKDDNNSSFASFFTYPPDTETNFVPKDPSVHKTLSIKQVLERKLHWVTLGGQYDWTNRVYPGEKPPVFPPDISGLLETLFPQTLAQAAIVNFYTPGDTMMMHRDVSEETDKGLVSLSMGCDALFMISPNNFAKDAQVDQTASVTGDNHNTGKDKEYLLLRIRSGDAIYMTQEARYAWHGVPKVLKGTCPDYLENWPAEHVGSDDADKDKYADWAGWMRNKRINLNVRQMRD
ncbi:hypothetical protein BD289DRAFT_478560 [Coniella lustricola]|uniref:mRNA N(6)-methyladenine demethylase n=1 Tax=Coniella lustricola TaxID=2025994 RepID=A0A2T3ALW7_9PEZI|nr:hypothetical protein BD289DRAFT_478560 [Coniella lustricola]